MSRYNKIIISLALAFFISLFTVSMEGFAKKCENVRESTLRLHILANSDTSEDQELKLKVRDEILKEYGGRISFCSSKEKAKEIVSGDLRNIENTAKKVLMSEGCDYNVEASLENTYFNNRNYLKSGTNVIMPAGSYDALRIKIGEAKGHNWWCVMYPPLCIPVCCGEDAEKCISMIEELNKGINIKAKFAIIEWGEKFIYKLTNR